MRWCALKRLVFHQEEAPYDWIAVLMKPMMMKAGFDALHHIKKKNSRGTASLVLFTSFMVTKNVDSGGFSYCMKDL
jgi:hypothetical protein